MRLLLDTHVALWAITDHPLLGKQGRQLIESPENEVWISVASLWEISIKRALGRGDMPVTCKEAIAYFEQSGYCFLSISPTHAALVEELPLHHNDPFDRMLVAQSLAEPMRLMTHDRQIAQYGDSIITV